MNLTTDLLEAALQIPRERAELWAGCMDEAAVRWGISGPADLAAWLGQCGHESLLFTRLKENLNYSVEGLLNTFSRERISAQRCGELGRLGKVGEDGYRPADQEAIAEAVYGGAWGLRELGNTQPGDGKRFLGRAPLGVTGRANYERFFEVMDMAPDTDPTFLEAPHLGSMAAGWFWFTKGCSALANAGNIAAVTKKVNPGMAGFDERCRLTAGTLKVLQDAAG